MKIKNTENQRRLLSSMKIMTSDDYSDYSAYFKDQEILMDLLEKGSDKVDGLGAGKVLQTTAGDNYARYLVTKVTKNWVHVDHIPYMDGYRDMSVIGGKMDRRVADQMVRIQEFEAKMFGGNK